MNKHIESKHSVIQRTPYEVYMGFTDMRNFVNFLPEDKKEGIEADFDSITGTLQGIRLGVKVVSREPYSRIVFQSADISPLPFSFVLHFDEADGGAHTDFHIELDTELNAMMNMLIGHKLRDGVDKIVDALSDASKGKFPEGFNPADYGAGTM